MALINPKEIIKKAQRNGYAIAAFNVHNLETVQAVIQGAQKLKAPVMIATTPGTVRHAGIKQISAIVRTAAKNADIPVAMHLDHCSDYGLIEECVKNGYTSVMIDASKLSFEENIKVTRKTVALGRAANVCVEAEIGRIGGVEDDVKVDKKSAFLTLPSEAASFAEKTGIDTLAIAIGTAHGIYKGEPKLDYERLKEIRAIVDIPLVLHGASGVPADAVKKAIKYGISKVNIATELKIPFADAIKEVFAKNSDENDPRVYMGAGRDAAQIMVETKILMCSSNGKA